MGQAPVGNTPNPPGASFLPSHPDPPAVSCPGFSFTEAEWRGRKIWSLGQQTGFRFSSAFANNLLWDPGQGLPSSGPVSLCVNRDTWMGTGEVLFSFNSE